MHKYDLKLRPQIVNPLNPECRDIIWEFKTLTGVGALLNTNFNLQGYPFVGMSGVALETLKKSERDYLSLGPLLAAKRTSQ